MSDISGQVQLLFDHKLIDGSRVYVSFISEFLAPATVFYLQDSMQSKVNERMVAQKKRGKLQHFK